MTLADDTPPVTAADRIRAGALPATLEGEGTEACAGTWTRKAGRVKRFVGDYQRRKSVGECVRPGCDALALPGVTLCKPHLDDLRARRRRSINRIRARRRKANLCIECGVATEGRRRCLKCEPPKAKGARRRTWVDERKELLVAQDGKCAICTCLLKESSGACLDHCHETGAIRGVLCHRCNAGLGSFRDSIESLEAAIAYLTKARSP